MRCLSRITSEGALRSGGKVLRINLSEANFGDAEVAEALDSLQTTQVTMGRKCAQFEAAFADYIGSRNAIFVNSGSSANLLAWFAVANPLFPLPGGCRAWRPGAEVIVPAVTWSTTLWPIVQAGGVPVLADCDPDTLQIMPDAIEAAIGPETVGVCPVHALGNACDMSAIQEICRAHGLILIEDTCEALGTNYEARRVGTFGLMGTYSFYFSHHMTTIEGGMIVTDDDEVADLLRCLRAHGWSRDMKTAGSKSPGAGDFASRFNFVNTGFNVRPTEINAAFGLHQIGKLEANNAVRRAVSKALIDGLQPLIAAGDIAVMRTTPGADPAFFGFPLLCRDTSSRDRLAKFLETEGIECRPIICGNMARQPAMAHVRHRVPAPLTGADRIMDCGLYFGTHPSFHDDDVAYIVATVTSFFERAGAS